MHKELSQQVTAKENLKKQMQDADKNGYLEGLKLIDRRMALADRNRTHLSQKIRQGINQSHDYELLKQKKLNDEKKRKDQSLEERRLIEESIMKANEAEAKLIQDRRAKLRNIKDEDRKEKEQQREGSSRRSEMAKEDFFTGVFALKPHQSYDRRARQDKVVDYMAENFLKSA